MGFMMNEIVLVCKICEGWVVGETATAKNDKLRYKHERMGRDKNLLLNEFNDFMMTWDLQRFSILWFNDVWSFFYFLI